MGIAHTKMGGCADARPEGSPIASAHDHQTWPAPSRRRTGGPRPSGAPTSVGAAPFEHKGHKSHSKIDRQLTRQLAQMRVATAKYATDLEQAKADGYRIITPNMEDMGFHYLNPAISDFDVTKPPILVYARRAGEHQLVALEWVFPSKPKKPPLKGATVRFLPGRVPLRRRNLYACVLRG